MDEIQILIIDDEKVIRKGVERALSGKGFVISQAENGEKGIEMIKEKRAAKKAEQEA